MKEDKRNEGEQMKKFTVLKWREVVTHIRIETYIYILLHSTDFFLPKLDMLKMSS
jgi:hypothetical protein